MKVALVIKENTFSDAWVAYLEEKGIEYIPIDPYASDCINKILQADYFFWHFDHFDYRDHLCAKGIIGAIENKIITFPNLSDAFFFDDKLSQKYLFDALSISSPKSFVSYTKNDALNYLQGCTYPIVAKLRRGAGSSNVFKLDNTSQAKQFVQQAFSEGFSIFNREDYLQKRLKKAKEDNKGLSGIVKAYRGQKRNQKNAAIQYKEAGYVLFQEYVENENFDIRVVVINQNKAFSARRDAQAGDWRSSGSGIASYPDENLDQAYIKEAFSTAQKLNTRCIAIDFVKNTNTNSIYAIEMSVFYAFYSMKPTKGYWDNRLDWHEDDKDPQWWLMEGLVNNIKVG